MSTDKDLTVGEIAERLDCSEATVYRELADGKIAGAYKFRQQWRVPRECFEAYLDSLRVGGSSADPRRKTEHEGVA